MFEKGLDNIEEVKQWMDLYQFGQRNLTHLNVGIITVVVVQTEYKNSGYLSEKYRWGY